MRALLDVNVLIALLDAAHADHGTAARWLRRHREGGWASCPLTQNGCVRIMAQPAYPNAHPAAVVAARLQGAVETDHHVFWPDDVSILGSNRVAWDRAIGPRQLTDLYSLTLAVEHGGRFVTFDRRISTDMVRGAGEEHLHVL